MLIWDVNKCFYIFPIHPPPRHTHTPCLSSTFLQEQWWSSNWRGGCWLHPAKIFMPDVSDQKLLVLEYIFLKIHVNKIWAIDADVYLIFFRKLTALITKDLSLGTREVLRKVIWLVKMYRSRVFQRWRLYLEGGDCI